ncbi:hypothetical protein FOZ62_026605, partial [Perkinsus olseni]
MVCLQEPAARCRNLRGFRYHGQRQGEEAAIISRFDLPCHTVLTARDVCIVRSTAYGAVSLYLHTADEARREEALRVLHGALEAWPRGVPLLICADTNAWNTAWGSTVTAANRYRPQWSRGDYLVQWCTERQIRILNDEVSLPSFESERHSSWIDASFLYGPADVLAPVWYLEDDLLGSDHRLVRIEVAGDTPVKPRLAHGLTDIAAVKREAAKLSRNLSPYDITEALSALVREFTPEAPATAGATWWTPRLGMLKAKLKRAQRRYHRHKREHGPDAPSTVHHREVRSAARRKFNAEAKKAKGVAADRFYKDLQHYSRCVRRGAPRIPPAAICPPGVNQADFLLSRLLPSDPTRDQDVAQVAWPNQEEPIPPVSLAELRDAAGELRRDAAPGSDDVTNDIIKDSLPELGEHWTYQLTRCLQFGLYPFGWKQSRGVFVHKPGRDPSLPNGWRPICLVKSGSKLFERIIVERLLSCPQIADRLRSPAVHGFCRGKSVDSAVYRVVGLFRDGKRRGKNCPVATIQLDVRNAFPSVRHSHILRTLAEYKVPPYLLDILKSYLGGQAVSADYGCDHGERGLQCGVQQGSVLGPFLYLLSTLPLVDRFKPLEALGIFLTLFADDTTISLSARTRAALVNKWKRAEGHLLEWADDAGLSWEPEKSQALIPRTIGEDLTLQDVPIQVVNVLRVLGVWIDKRLTFQHHIRLKVSEALAKLNRLRHLGWERASLTGAKVIRTYRVGILPGLAHGVCVWYDGLKSATARDLVMRVPAMVARIALRAPRNASNSALVVAAGLTPAHVELAGMAARRLALLGDELALGRLLKVKGLQHDQPSVAIQQWRALPIQPWETRLHTVIAEREQALHYAKQAMRSRNAIYTDGSVVLDRRAGAGCVVFRKGAQVHSASWRLPSYSSITE